MDDVSSETCFVFITKCRQNELQKHRVVYTYTYRQRRIGILNDELPVRGLRGNTGYNVST